MSRDPPPDYRRRAGVDDGTDAGDHRPRSARASGRPPATGSARSRWASAGQDRGGGPPARPTSVDRARVVRRAPAVPITCISRATRSRPRSMPARRAAFHSLRAPSTRSRPAAARAAPARWPPRGGPASRAGGPRPRRTCRCHLRPPCRRARPRARGRLASMKAATLCAGGRVPLRRTTSPAGQSCSPAAPRGRACSDARTRAASSAGTHHRTRSRGRADGRPGAPCRCSVPARPATCVPTIRTAAACSCSGYCRVVALPRWLLLRHGPVVVPEATSLTRAGVTRVVLIRCPTDGPVRHERLEQG